MNELVLLGRWSVSGQGILVVVALLSVHILALSWALQRFLALKAAAMTGLEAADWETVQQWEVRAMACVVHAGLPGWQKGLIGEISLEEAAVDAWARLREFYRKRSPRKDTSLFGDMGPW